VIQAIRFEVVERLSDDDHLELLRAGNLVAQTLTDRGDKRSSTASFISFILTLLLFPLSNTADVRTGFGDVRFHQGKLQPKRLA
jgi:hypothetical protein